MADGSRAVPELEDPVGIVLESWTRPNGIAISKVRSPLAGMALV